MKVKLGNILKAIDSLTVLQKAPLNAVTSFKVVKMIRELDGHLKDYDTVRIAKIKEMGKEEADKSWKVIDKNVEKFNDEINALLDKDVDLKFEAIKADDLKKSNGEPIDIEPMYLSSLIDWFIKE